MRIKRWENTISMIKYRREIKFPIQRCFQVFSIFLYKRKKFILLFFKKNWRWYPFGIFAGCTIRRINLIIFKFDFPTYSACTKMVNFIATRWYSACTISPDNIIKCMHYSLQKYALYKKKLVKLQLRCSVKMLS